MNWIVIVSARSCKRSSVRDPNRYTGHTMAWCRGTSWNPEQRIDHTSSRPESPSSNSSAALTWMVRKLPLHICPVYRQVYVRLSKNSFHLSSTHSFMIRPPKDSETWKSSAPSLYPITVLSLYLEGWLFSSCLPLGLVSQYGISGTCFWPRCLKSLNVLASLLSREFTAEWGPCLSTHFFMIGMSGKRIAPTLPTGQPTTPVR